MEAHAHHHHETPTGGRELTQVAISATLHCLTGCAIGEVLGMVLGTGLGWSNAATLAASVILAFAVGYTLTMQPLLKAGLGLKTAAGLALASDTLSIGTMEIVDSALMLLIPGAMAATLVQPLFWFSLAASLILAGIAAFPVNRWLIARGKGHAVIHQHHGH